MGALMRLWNGSVCIFQGFEFGHRTPIRPLASWLAIAAVLIAVGPPSASARVHASIVVDAQTGKVLEAHNPDRRCYPASLAKLMTLYITFQQLRTGKMTLGERLHVSRHAAAQQPVKLYLRPGQHISVKSCILAITTKSANDAAVVLAEGISGTEWKFARLMNETAQKLGMDRTTFRNASGLPNRYQKTTARDMATLALAILHTFPQYFYFFKAKSFDFRGRTVYGHDYLLNRYPGVDGMKTGYTRASGFNIVTSVVQHGQRLVGVLMGGRTARARDQHMIALLNRSFARLRPTIRAADSQREVANARSSADMKSPDEGADPNEMPRRHFEWIVQIGGHFRNAYRVRRALRSALRTAPEQLKDAKPLVVRLGGRQYRARFSNLTEATAKNTCRVLHGKRFTCNVLRVPSSGMVLASAGQ